MAHPPMDISGQKLGIHPLLAIVIRRLQEHGRLARIHGGVVEEEFGHAASLDAWSGPIKPSTAAAAA